MTLDAANGDKKYIPTLAAQLAKRGHEVYHLKTAKEACEMALSLIGADERVGVPGTMTARQIGLVGALKDRGTPVAEHWDKGDKTTAQAQEEERAADWFVTSANAVTADGMLVSCDGFGNRVACMAWGPKKHLYLLGLNKFTPNLPSAFNRVREYAALQNALRFHPDLAEKEEELLQAADDLCRAFVVIDKRPGSCERSVVLLIEESLGY